MECPDDKLMIYAASGVAHGLIDGLQIPQKSIRIIQNWVIFVLTYFGHFSSTIPIIKDILLGFPINCLP